MGAFSLFHGQFSRRKWPLCNEINGPILILKGTNTKHSDQLCQTIQNGKSIRNTTSRAN